MKKFLVFLGFFLAVPLFFQTPPSYSQGACGSFSCTNCSVKTCVWSNGFCNNGVVGSFSNTCSETPTDGCFVFVPGVEGCHTRTNQADCEVAGPVGAFRGCATIPPTHTPAPGAPTNTPPPSGGGGGPTPVPQCGAAPLVMIDKGEGFKWYGASVQVFQGSLVCFRSSPSGNKYTSRPTQDGTGYKGAVNVNGTNCFTPKIGDTWTTGAIEAYENQCTNGVLNGTCEQLYFSDSCRNFTDLVVLAATATPAPSPTKIPSPSPTSTPVACQQLKVFKGSTDISANLSSIAAGNTLTFTAYAGSTAKKITFQLTSNNQKQAPVEVVTKASTTLSGYSEASFVYTVSAAETISVTVTNVSY